MKSCGKDLEDDALSNLATSAGQTGMKVEWLATKHGFRSGAQWRYYGKFNLNTGLGGLNCSGEKSGCIVWFTASVLK